MSIDNLPAAIQSVIQQNFLEREFHDSLTARLGFRDIATREPFPAGVGETLTRTRPALLAAITTPMTAAANTDVTSGLTAQNYGVEQYVMGIDQYPGMMQLNTVTSQVAIASLFLRNARTLAEQASRSVNMLAHRCLYDNYMGGNSRVIATLGTPGTAVQVDDVRGFFQTINTAGQVVAISASNHVNVTINGTVYQLNGAVADGTTPATIPSWLSNLTFSGSSSNTSTAPGGFSGVLTLSTNVSTANATIGNAVVSSVAPTIFRPGVASTASVFSLVSTSLLTMQTIMNAKAQLENNAVPVLDDGTYHLYLDAQQAAGLYLDTEFQSFTRGRLDSPEYRRGVIAEMLGIKLVLTNLNPVQTLTFSNSSSGVVRRALLVGKDALIEGDFTAGYEGASREDDGASISVINVVDGIAHITRPPLDVLSQVITQSWSYIGGFSAPTDQLTTSVQIPTASAAAFKRAAIIESV